MSGTLVLNDRDAWMPAGWVFDNILEQLGHELSTVDAELAVKLREGTTQTSVGYVDLKTASAQRLWSLLAALETIREKTLARGPLSFHMPAFYEGYVKRLDSLIEMVRRDERVAAR